MALEAPRLVLGLADEPAQPLAPDGWIGAFVALGSMLRRHAQGLDDRQLVLAVSVPRRDYAAALIGCGWMLGASPPQLDDPCGTFRRADANTYLRAVTDKRIIVGKFGALDEDRRDPRVRTGGHVLPLDRFKAVAVLDGSCESVMQDVPEPGFVAALTGAEATWAERMAAPPTDLALVGTKSWLLADLDAFVGNGAAEGASGTPLASYVLPTTDHAATWATPVIAAARLGEGAALPAQCQLAILDRYVAIKYLNDVTVPIVVCIVDRSVADESAAETIVEARLNNSRPLSVMDELRWTPPKGVEALAFTVAL